MKNLEKSMGINMPLPEKYRSKLDEIVSKMEANKEPDENIRAVIDDFKQKYDEYKKNLAFQEDTKEINTLRGQVEKEKAKGMPQRIMEARQEMFKELPFSEQLLSGAGEILYSTPGIKQAYDAGAGLMGAERPGDSPEDYEAYRQASKGNFAAGLGNVVGDVALMYGPGRALGGLKSVSAAPKLAQYGLAGLGSTGLHQSQRIQSGRGLDPIGGAIEMGSSLAIPYAGGKLGPALQETGKRIAQTAFKAGTKVKGKKVMEGKVLDNFMDKYLGMTAIKSEDKILKHQDILGDEFDKLITRAKGKDVDPLEAVVSAKIRIERLAKSGDINLTHKDKILKSLDDIGDSMEPILNKDGKMSFKAAQKFKRGTLDEMANWDKAPKIGQVDPELGPPAEAARTVRGKLVTQMAKQDPIFKPLNKEYKEMADIRPFVQQAAERAKANRGLSLQDIAALAAWTVGTGGLNLAWKAVKGVPFMVSRGQKSPAVAKVLYELGKGMNPQGEVADQIKRQLMQMTRSTYETGRD